MLINALSPNDGIFLSDELIIASTNVEPDLGSPTINKGIKSSKYFFFL
tara:strand:+ start:389 stop:532 length:144 start_codon:yes stop_codon:yes gene_type:complete